MPPLWHINQHFFVGLIETTFFALFVRVIDVIAEDGLLICVFGDFLFLITPKKAW